MDEARHRLSVSVDKATASAKKVHEHIVAANESAARVATFSGTIEVKLHGLHGRVTAELRPVVEDIQNDVMMEKSEEVILTNKLSEALVTEKTLGTELGQAQDDKARLTEESQRYTQEAQLLADNATKERDYRIKAEKSLSWYRWHSFWLKIASVAIVIIIVVIAFMWFTGRLAGLFSKI